MQGVKCSDGPINGFKVFAATMVADRAILGEKVTDWITKMRRVDKTFVLREIVVTQSSDAEFHCISVTATYWQEVAKW